MSFEPIDLVDTVELTCTNPSLLALWAVISFVLVSIHSDFVLQYVFSNVPRAVLFLTCSIQAHCGISLEDAHLPLLVFHTLQIRAVSHWPLHTGGYQFRYNYSLPARPESFNCYWRRHYWSSPSSTTACTSDSPLRLSS